MSEELLPDPDRRRVLEPGCSRCPGLAKARTRIAWGVGPDDADVVVVGEAPAVGDPDAERWQGGNHTGMAYTSRHSGQRIRQLFAELGYADRTYYTNAVKCFPRAEVGFGSGSGSNSDDDGSNSDDDGSEGSSDVDTPDQSTNREPTAAERDACREHL
ncbi:MAG: uracil-DNA glycosylase family protein, partial [Haloferacaceae archaeon]